MRRKGASSIPTLQYVVRILWFYLGLAILSLGYSLVIAPMVGAAPWDIFHLGMAKQSGISLSLVIQLTGVVIILLNLALGIRPGVGMFLNMFSVGPMLQFLLQHLPMPDSLPGRWLMLGLGLFVIGVGTALYVSADLGPGPRDGLMIGLTRKTGLPVAVIKNSMDLAVAVTGWLLGGPLGLGTVAVALGIGPSIQFGMYLVARLATYRPFTGFVRPVALKR
ncbi:MAG: YczE/YyaS/YitT family protein [Bacillota bacterium]